MRGLWDITGTWHEKSLCKTECVFSKKFLIKLTLQWCGSHRVRVELPFAVGKPYVSVLFRAFAPFVSFPPGLENFKKSSLY